MCLRLSDVCKAYPSKTLLERVNWHIAPRQRWGLVGPNGAGKSTLFQLILRQNDPDSGTIVPRPGLVLGHLAQELLGDQGRTLQAEMWAAFPVLMDLQAAITELETQLQRSGPDDDLGVLIHAQSEALTKWERLDGYTVDARIGRVLSGLGFSEADRHRLVRSFSGGWQMRAALAKLLLQEPELLLLDEPTNHLDLQAIQWLESYLADYRGALIVISHDRHFLDAVTTHTAELDSGALTTYTGAYSQYRIQRKERREAQLVAFNRQQAEITRLETYINRFRASATRSSQAKSREKQLDKLERLEAPKTESSAARFQFSKAPPSGRIVLTLNDVSKGYDGQPLFRIPRLEIERGMRLAIVGPNGAGKSTLLRLLAQQEKPDTGELSFGLRVLPGYFSQNQTESLAPDATVIDEAYEVDETATLARIRSLLACLLFTGDDVFKPVRMLSGGERSRLALAKLLLRPLNVLLLDEPTNHLDLAAKEELAEALTQFDGTLVFISHDRHFLDTVATHILHVEDGTHQLHLGHYSAFLATKTRVEAQTVSKPTRPATGANEKPGTPAKPTKPSYKQAQTLQALEARILSLEQRLAELEVQMALPDTYQDAERAQRVQSDYDDTKAALEAANESWCSLVDEMGQSGS